MSRTLALSAILFSAVMIAQVDADPAPTQIEPAMPPVQQVVAFDGTWEGKIFFDKETYANEKATPTNGETVRLEISGLVVRAFYSQDNGPLTEIMPGNFHIAPVYSNAVIWGTHNDGIWVETWNFTVTQKDKDTLLVEYGRLVNNLGLTPDTNSKFATRGYGEFKRVSP